MKKTNSDISTLKKNRKFDKKVYRRDINKGYIILYLVVFILIVVGEIILCTLNKEFTILGLIKDIIENLMGVLAAFLVFDIAHEKISKDSYASEVSEQILDTLRYHPEVFELYEDSKKKEFINAFINSVAKDSDVADMINSYLKEYLLTTNDFNTKSGLTEKDSRIRTAFSYRFVLKTARTTAFKDLKAKINNNADPYFYVQEEINYSVKYISEAGNYTNNSKVKIAFTYDNAALDRFLRGNDSSRNEELLSNCIFREILDIEEEDKKYIFEISKNRDEIKRYVEMMIRPNLTIDQYKGKVVDVQIIPEKGSQAGEDQCLGRGIIVVFDVGHSVEATKHDIHIIFHIPKRWNTELTVALVEPTKNPGISLSYNEDEMDVEMYPFMNKSESSSYETALNRENGVYSIQLSDEWTIPVSGAVFTVKREGSSL